MALPPHLADLESRLASRLEEAIAGFRRAFEERLRSATSQLLDSAAEVPAPALEAVLAGFETESLEAAPRRAGADAALVELLVATRAMDRAGTQGEVLESLLDAARKSADRAALLLAREEGIEIWSAAGFEESDLAGRDAAWSDALRRHLMATRGALRLDAADAAEVTASLRLSPAGAAVVVPLVLRDRVAALLWADRRDDLALALPPFQLLAHLAAQRLELQAISERDATPTLYESPLTPGEELPLWSLAAAIEAAPELAEPPPMPPIEEAAEQAGAELWAAPPEAPAAAAAESASEAPAFEEPSSAGVVEQLFEVEAVPEPAPAAGEPPEPPELTLAGAEGAAEEEWVPEPEALQEAPPAAPPPPEPAPDLLSTVRLPLPSFTAPLPQPADESTKPFRIEPSFQSAPPPSAASTHEIQLPSASLAPPPAEVDISDDATQLSRPRPPLPLPPVEDPLDRTSSRTARTTEVAPPPDVHGPGLAFMAGRSARSGAEQPQHEEARRLARLLISEIKLYNEEQVLEGRRNRDLYHRLKEDIDRSRQIYEERVDAGVRSASDYFQQELVRSLAGGDPRALGI